MFKNKILNIKIIIYIYRIKEKSFLKVKKKLGYGRQIKVKESKVKLTQIIRKFQVKRSSKVKPKGGSKV